MLVLTADDVRQALPMGDAIEAVKLAYAAVSDGRVEMPLRSRVQVAPHDALSLFMPAYARTERGEALAVKVVSLFPQNPPRGLAYIQAAVLVLEADTGRALAILEGSSLTAIRTGAASGAAADVLARKESKVAAVFGAGAQGRTQLEAVCTVRPIERAWVFDQDSTRAESFVAEMAGKGPIPRDLRRATTSTEALREADVICTATTSLTPVFADTDLKEGAHISAVGSYTPEMQEVPPKTVKRALVVVDARSAALVESGDLIQPIRSGLFTESHVHAELGEIILGRRSGRESAAQVTYFKSVGIAAQDVLAAQRAVENARGLGLGREVPF